ncbi:hypothetical protein RFI_22731, partial [Reticulomyxa filosa]
IIIIIIIIIIIVIMIITVSTQINIQLCMQKLIRNHNNNSHDSLLFQQRKKKMPKKILGKKNGCYGVMNSSVNANGNSNNNSNSSSTTAATANANVLLATMSVLTIPANLMGMTLVKQINTFDSNGITNSNLNISHSHMIHPFNKHDNFVYSIFPIQNQLNNINPVASIHSMSIGAWVY